MSQPKKSTSAFDLLLKDFDVKKSDLDFKSLSTASNKRLLERVSLEGFAVIYSETGKLIAKAVLRNISLGGLALETPPVEIAKDTQIRVLLTGEGLILGSINCLVKWTSVLEEKSPANKIIGVEIINNASQFREEFNKFVNKKTKAAYAKKMKSGINSSRTDR